MSMIEIDDNDSNTVIIVKLSIVALTVLVMGFSVFKHGLRILRLRNKKIGFTKDK
jgi:hypothetical protein